MIDGSAFLGPGAFRGRVGGRTVNDTTTVSYARLDIREKSSGCTFASVSISGSCSSRVSVQSFSGFMMPSDAILEVGCRKRCVRVSRQSYSLVGFRDSAAYRRFQEEIRWDRSSSSCTRDSIERLMGG